MPGILLSTMGVRGDLNPFIAVGKELRARGYEVLFAVEPAMRDAVVQEGFEPRALTGDVLQNLSPHLDAIVGGSTPIAAVKPIVRDWLTSALPAKVEDLLLAGADAHLLVAHAGQLAAPIAAELLGVPWVQLTMTALNVPSANVGPSLLRIGAGSGPRLINRASWAALELVTRRLADPAVNDVRRHFGLRGVRNAMGRGGHSKILTAVVASPEVSPRQPDWPTFVQTTGYCFWDVPTGWREPPELTAFLDKPDPVVAISFGSIAPFVGHALTPLYEAAVSAVVARGHRALVVGATSRSSDRVFAIPFAPFSQVYPRCTAAIHHGGAATVGEALRAGIPSLAVPWGIDQFFTAAQLVRTGAGRARRARRFGPVAARHEIDVLLDQTSYTRCADVLGERIRQEDGVGNVCDRLERVLAERAEPSRT